MAGSGMQGAQGGYAQLMQALMSNPQAFTGGGFGQTLAANPMQWGMQQQPGQQFPGVSPQAAAMAAWQPQMPAPQAAANPIPGLVAQQQAAQQAAAMPPVAATPSPDLNNGTGGSGGE